ncbi:MAG: dihydroxyacetone kinase subunit DhaK [Verrucomicrobiae bacterium]|nr:dihydroxyacetone kinase subunit DhaK [Verrucomicrobiae bacterium]
MAMKKFINDPSRLTEELLEGFALAHRDIVSVSPGRLVTRVQPKSPDKVALVTLGGAGHEPALSGFVGEGMLDISVVGDIFAAPGPPPVFEALKRADRPAGTLFVVLNHAGDVLSADMAMQMAEAEGLKIRKLLTHEDIAAGPDAPETNRRGLVGCIPLYKIAGAAAEAGRSLEEVHAIAERFNRNMATLAVAMKAATHPATGETLFALADDEMEIGMGQHGEAGTGPCKIRSADETAALMMERLLHAIGATKGDRLMVILNGAGATTLMELYIVLNGVKKYLDERGIEIVACRVGELLTVQEMAGFQMFAARMDDELLALWNAPCRTPSLTVA